MTNIDEQKNIESFEVWALGKSNFDTQSFKVQGRLSSDFSIINFEPVRLFHCNCNQSEGELYCCWEILKCIWMIPEEFHYKTVKQKFDKLVKEKSNEELDESFQIIIKQDS